MQSFNSVVLGYPRPTWSGLVWISDNQPGNQTGQALARVNARSVKGIVVPVKTTGRPSAPRPLSGAPTGAALSLDKGHLMALELGGPDVSENIAPQSHAWQAYQNGGWRSMEREVLRLAMEVMQWNNKPDPATVATVGIPDLALFFQVGPYSSLTTRGEPEEYIGSITVIEPYIDSQNRPTYTARQSSTRHIDELRSGYRLFSIKPGTFAWK